MNNEIIIEIVDDLNHKMKSCLNGDWTPTQCLHYAYGMHKTIETFIANDIIKHEDFEEALHLISNFMGVMEHFMKYE